MIINDRIPLSSDREYTDEGYLVVPARIARTGVQEYYAGEMGLKDREATDTVRVYRPASEVFSSDSLGSFASKPVTDNHPPALLDAKNAKIYAVGFCEPEVVKDGDYVKAILHITDGDAIARVKSGKVELSNGYTSRIDWTSGVTDSGETYDAIQTEIRGNHIAIVDAGRCGAACRIADSKPEETEMTKLTIGAIDFEVTDQQREALEKLQTRLADAEKEVSEKEEDEEKEKAKKGEEEAKKETSDALKKADVLQAKLDDALSRVPNAEMLDQLLENRLDTRDRALKVIPSFDHKGKDCEAIRAEVVAAKCPTVDTSKASADYIRARFDMLAEQAKGQPSIDEALRTAYLSDADRGTDPVTQARAKFVKDSAEAWKLKSNRG